MNPRYVLLLPAVCALALLGSGCVATEPVDDAPVAPNAEAFSLPEPYQNWPANASELFTMCDMSIPPAGVRYGTLPASNCATTSSTGVVTIDRAQCPDVKLCCGLGHEAIHVRQLDAARRYCLGNALCLQKLMVDCRALSEADAYLAQCNTSGCGEPIACGFVATWCAKPIPDRCRAAFAITTDPCACGSRNGTCGGTCPTGQSCGSTATGCGCVTPTPAPSPSTSPR